MQHPGEKSFIRISIHAPVKGATGSHMLTHEITGDISIHAPVKGATYGP